MIFNQKDGISVGKGMRYKKCVENDEDFLIFEVKADVATFIKR